MTDDAPLIGRTLAGRFRITELIGEGGMATVYRGTQEGEPPEIAIKIMNADLASDEKFVRRFRREAKSAARLKHPNSVQIFDYGVEDGLPYIAMELLKGAELMAILHHEKRLPEVRAARIMAQVCSALAAAHAQGIVHRDLKPENIMIQRVPGEQGGDLVKVLDFGIAKIMDRETRKKLGDKAPDSTDGPPSSLGGTALTMMGTIVGTPEYMSPEQSRGGEVGPRSDVYACGVLLYQLVTGRVPFSTELPIETAMMHVTAIPPPPSNFTPAIHAQLEELILKALAKAPEDRPESARAFEERLEALLPELATQRHATSPPPPNLKPEPLFSKLDTTQPALVAPPPPPLPSDLAAGENAAGEGGAGAPEALARTVIADPAEMAAAAQAAAAARASMASLPDGPPIARAPMSSLAHTPTGGRMVPRKQGLSDAAALALGAGLGVVLLAIAALVLFR